MKGISLPTLAIVCALTSGWSTAIASPPSERISIPLTATSQNAGKIAQATLVPVGDATEIVLFVGGVPSNVAQPPHLYTYIYPGMCGDLGPKPVIAMNDQVVLGDRLPQLSRWMSKRVPIALNELRSGDYALVVRTSPADGFVNIFCGNLKKTA
ncbi:hypothetical protein [Paraburkholderia sp. HP33-1]|uniref:hypothetical protein n=1 Tax=Paraburkholderia sp. HP33-1 TaxID=2883243 RepID=UPI001F372C96|nr:hypothetical protein [Paraburkholderia sp. HP33-1]